MFALEVLAACPAGLPQLMFHLFRVNAVSVRFTRCKGFLGGGVLVVLGFLVCLLVSWFLLGLVWFPRFAFASLHAFVSSLIVHNAQTAGPRAKKMTVSNFRNLCKPLEKRFFEVRFFQIGC